MNNEKISKHDAIILAATGVIIIALVFGAVYGLNAVMAGFIAREDALQRAEWERARAEAREHMLLQARYDRLAEEDYLLAAFFDAGIVNHYDGQFLEIGYKIVNAEYIFIGTSHITHGVTPQVFFRQTGGTRFFNFALNGSNPSYYLWWYNEVFRPSGYITPRAIIIGVDWFMFDSEWLWRRPAFDYQYLRAPRPPPARDGEHEADEAWAGGLGDAMRFTGDWWDVDALVEHMLNRFPVFASRERFIDLILPEGEPELIIADEPEPSEQPELGGQIILNRPQMPPGGWPEGFVLRYFYKGFVPWEAYFHGFDGIRRSRYFSQQQYEDFRALLRQIQADGIDIVFVMAPEFRPHETIPQLDEKVALLSSLADEKNIPFLNYNTELISHINADPRYYSDPGHLNYRGAQAFSRMLFDDLAAILGFN